MRLPVWVEKILTRDEVLPHWPVQGTSGYEAARVIVRLLTRSEGLSELDRLWREQTGREGDFAAALAQAKGEVIRQDLAAELHQLIALARAAAEEDNEAEMGDEALREAVLALLIAFPRYRTYFDDGTPAASDLRLMDQVAARACKAVRSDAAVQFITRLLTEAATDPARAFRTRFQQVTGALLAKSHEDTAGFRWNRYLAANEVGADPDETVLSPAEFGRWLVERQATAAEALTLTSTHDTKRAEDARMRLVALSHCPEAFAEVWADANAVPGAAEVEVNLRWYIVQSLLAIWEPESDAIAERLAAHVEKAMREANEITTWTHPNADAEALVQVYVGRLVTAWQVRMPEAAALIFATGEALSLAQLVLKCVMPGIPDFYQGSEGPVFHLTDPDNRLPVDFERMAGLHETPGFAGQKARLTRQLLSLRRKVPGLFATGRASAEALDDGQIRVVRAGPQGVLAVTLRLQGIAERAGAAAEEGGGTPVPMVIDWQPASDLAAG